jgi:hypothetical protein
MLLIEKKLRGSSKFRVRAVCTLAPTDGLAVTSNAVTSMPKSAGTAFLSVHGGLDLQVSGIRAASQLDAMGTGFRQYDRSTAHKAMVFLPLCCHTRFNRTWNDFGIDLARSQGHPAGSQLEGGEVLPSDTLSTPLHEALAKEYIGGFFSLVLNKDFGLRDLFDNSLQNAAGKPAAIQWSFGSLLELIDEFDASNSSATLPAASSRTKLAPLTPPASAAVGTRDRHVPHDTNALVIDVAGVGAPTATVRYALAAPASGGRDLTAFDAITFRLGILYPVTNQAAIDATPNPAFTVSLTDSSGTTLSLTSAEMIADMANGWTTPVFKTDGGANATLLFLQTVPFNFATLMLKNPDAPQTGLDLSKAMTLTIEFDTSAGSGEVWLDSILLTKV